MGRKRQIFGCMNGKIQVLVFNCSSTPHDYKGLKQVSQICLFDDQHSKCEPCAEQGECTFPLPCNLPPNVVTIPPHRGGAVTK